MFSLFYVHQVYQVAPGQRETDVLIETSSSYCRSYSKSLNQVAENIWLLWCDEIEFYMAITTLLNNAYNCLIFY